MGPVPAGQRRAYDAPILFASGEHHCADASWPGSRPKVARQVREHLVGALPRHALIVGGNLGVGLQETVTRGQDQDAGRRIAAHVRPVRFVHHAPV